MMRPDELFRGGVMSRHLITSGTLARLEVFDWGVRLRSPVISVTLPHLNDTRQLADYMRYAALLQKGQYLEETGDVRNAARAYQNALACLRPDSEPPQAVRDLWLHRDVGIATGSFTTDVHAHGAVLLKLAGGEKKG